MGDALEAEGGRYTGAVYVGPPAVPFDWVFDIEGLSHVHDAAASAVRDRMADGTAYRVSMALPGVGPAALTFEGTPGAVLPASGHPVDVVMESDVLFIPPEHRDDDERAAAQALQAAVLRYLEACCTALDPAYALVHVEEATPTPAALAAGGRLGGDVFVSRRLAGLDGLGTALADVARVSETLDWETGTFYSSDFLAETPDRPALVAAWTAASAVIADLLRHDR
ncbi:hypothetical protein J3R04_001446 [Spirilliplanes yamanashiensis]|uniref:hypothetical protein n=1 Tax=Spirilliplanes yamanashiensis TaxID=42233 RepID=UPI0027882D50|nr:hypothetical protein [Spirilliplanes yamanashiensis]MDP9815476.1 hypothetical protein [Spirilliplanes yamanashiensis]